MANFPSSVKSFTTRLTDDTIAASHMNDVQDEINAIEDEFLNGITVDIAFDDSKALVFGTGLDAHIEYDGLNLHHITSNANGPYSSRSRADLQDCRPAGDAPISPGGP